LRKLKVSVFKKSCFILTRYMHAELNFFVFLFETVKCFWHTKLKSNMAAFLSRDINDDAKCRRYSGKYACGGWERANPIPDGKSSWSTFGKLWQDNQQVLRNILETPPSNQEVRLSTAARISTNKRQEILR
jgi:predicted metalloendopeptidase